MSKLATIQRENVIKVIIDKMLEPYNSSFDQVLANPEVEGLPWYSYYTFNSKEDLEKFKEFFIITLTKNTIPKYNKKAAESEWSWFNLMYGLKENFQK